MKKALITSALALLAVPAAAQDFSPVITPSIVTGIGVTGAGIEAAEQQMRREGRPVSIARSFRSQLTAPSRSGVAVASMPYNAVPAVRDKVTQLFLTNGPRDPGYVAEVRKFVGSGAVYREYSKVAPRFGLRKNDAVDGYAFYMLAQWGVANDYRQDFTASQVRAVRTQAAHVLADIASALRSNAARQEFADTLIAQAILMTGGYENAVRSGDNGRIHTLVSNARKGGVRVFNMDPTKIALTGAGFRARD